MNKHNQYYSDWEESRETGDYRDQEAQVTYADHFDYGYQDDHPASFHDGQSYQNPSQSIERYTADERRQYDEQDGYYPAPDFAPAYYNRESERGFNLVNIADIRHNDYESNDQHEADYYAVAQQALPHDRQDLISNITASTKSSAIQMVADDFIDISKPSIGSRLPKVVTLAGVVLFGAVLAAWLLYSSQPELSAADIVQMETYDGEQVTPAIFNLTDLKECASLSDCIKDSLAESKAEIAQYTRETSALHEIPAVNSVPVTPKQNAVIEQNISTETTSESSLSDQLQVKKQWSIIRSTPDSNGNIITSLAKGVNVRIIASVGNWYEIEAINSAGTRGYMHRSTIDGSY